MDENDARKLVEDEEKYLSRFKSKMTFKNRFRKSEEYSTPDEIAEHRERRMYGGRTRSETRDELRSIDEVVFDGLVGTGDIEDVWDAVREDVGLLRYLD